MGETIDPLKKKTDKIKPDNVVADQGFVDLEMVHMFVCWNPAILWG